MYLLDILITTLVTGLVAFMLGLVGFGVLCMFTGNSLMTCIITSAGASVGTMVVTFVVLLFMCFKR